MNKKKLALTLLLSSASVSVFAAEVPTITVSQQAATVAEAVKAALADKIAKADFDKALADAATAATAAATAAKTAYDKVMGDVTTTQKERDTAKADLDKANAALTAAGLKDAGYFASAWAAVKSNQVATALLVTTAILVGAIVHATASNNNTVDADDID
jgi:uncharacterized GH25 family protein